MTIRPEVIEYVRTLVRGDNEANNRLEALLDDTGWDGYSSFLSAVFFYSIDQRFGGQRDTNAIISFVAEMRTDVDGVSEEIDATAAETVIASALDSSIEFDIAPDKLGKIQTLAAYKVLSEANLSDHDLETILAAAARLADASPSPQD